MEHFVKVNYFLDYSTCVPLQCFWLLFMALVTFSYENKYIALFCHFYIYPVSKLLLFFLGHVLLRTNTVNVLWRLPSGERPRIILGTSGHLSRDTDVP